MHAAHAHQVSRVPNQSSFDHSTAAEHVGLHARATCTAVGIVELGPRHTAGLAEGRWPPIHQLPAWFVPFFSFNSAEKRGLTLCHHTHIARARLYQPMARSTLLAAFVPQYAQTSVPYPTHATCTSIPSTCAPAYSYCLDAHAHSHRFAALPLRMLPPSLPHIPHGLGMDSAPESRLWNFWARYALFPQIMLVLTYVQSMILAGGLLPLLQQMASRPHQASCFGHAAG